MTDQVCKCCGQALPPAEGFDFAMPKGMAELVSHVRRAGRWGITTDRLFGLLYAGDPNGGPDTGIKVLHVRVNQANRLLRQHGWQICGEHTGSRGVYGRYVLSEYSPPPPKVVAPDEPYNLLETNWSTTPCR
jgi:hypothetical protein